MYENKMSTKYSWFTVLLDQVQILYTKTYFLIAKKTKTSCKRIVRSLRKNSTNLCGPNKPNCLWQFSMRRDVGVIKTCVVCLSQRSATSENFSIRLNTASCTFARCLCPPRPWWSATEVTQAVPLATPATSQSGATCTPDNGTLIPNASGTVRN